MLPPENIEDLYEPINNAPLEVRQIIDKVLKLEKSRLDRKRKSHINEDILEIVKESVQ
ncbi:hypothetical protein B6N60_03417 [Richelia sinica FACHB-800]|uniref:Uncharacterized protein n=1 Tax=Richelia sinica FACHB-800 TaxID=1357546 RepID=A0A975T9R5_9NOST|nr:hypothetical protein [Richelia sinica]MBD2663521.1 hypothetical protein [Richelia sinica FACHB-800]QXE24709.1 hypothetical protein B6N60_03417 [Richelia sinica FACHB-800]